MQDILETLGRIEGMLTQLLDREKPAKKKREEKKPSAGAESAIKLLNDLACKNFRNVYRPELEARIKEYGAVVVEAVICDRFQNWKDDPKMRQYLRPETLFNVNKFEGYQAAIPQQPKQLEIPPEPPRNNWEDEKEWRQWHEKYGSCTRH